MTQDASTPTKAVVTLEDFTEVVATALFRAAAARPAGRPHHGTTTIGIIYRPDGDGGPSLTNGIPPDQGAPVPGTLRGVGGALSEEGIGRLNAALRARGEAAAPLLRSLFADQAGTMAALFDLDAEQAAAVRADACRDDGTLKAMRLAAEAVAGSGVPVMLDFRLADDARAEGKRKWCVQSFTVGGSGSASTGSSGTTGGGTVTGSVTFGRCK